MDKALPLMDIYSQNESAEFDEFLMGILKENEPDNAQNMLKTIKNNNSRVKEVLETNRIYYEVPQITEEEFIKHPIFMDLSEYGIVKPLKYSYEQYVMHISAMNKFAEKNNNFIFRPCEDFAYRNIQIRIFEGKCVWIRKTNSPVMNFVIRHPKLMDAIANMHTAYYEPTDR